MGDEVREWLGYAEAAKLIKLSKRTIRRWADAGMPFEWRLTPSGQRKHVFDEDTLFEWKRQHLASNPIHQNRMRRRFIDAGETPPEWNEQIRAQRARAAAARDQGATRHPHTEEASEAVTEAAVTWEDVVRELPAFRGQAEHAILMRAMEDTPPACDGLETFTRDKFTDREEVEIMRGICATCPLFDLCAAFATAGLPAAGMWAGSIPSEIRSSS